MWLYIKSKHIPIEFQTKEKKFKKYQKVKVKPRHLDVAAELASYIIVILKNSHFTAKRLVAFLKILKPGVKSLERYTSGSSLFFKNDTIVTKKPKDTRMGRGKGLPVERISTIKTGAPILALSGLRNSVKVSVLLRQLNHKISAKSRPINSSK